MRANPEDTLRGVAERWGVNTTTLLRWRAEAGFARKQPETTGRPPEVERLRRKELVEALLIEDPQRSVVETAALAGVSAPTVMRYKSRLGIDRHWDVQRAEKDRVADFIREHPDTPIVDICEELGVSYYIAASAKCKIGLPNRNQIAAKKREQIIDYITNNPTVPTGKLLKLFGTTYNTVCDVRKVTGLRSKRTGWYSKDLREVRKLIWDIKQFIKEGA
jgi:transposase-like protein